MDVKNHACVRFQPKEKKGHFPGAAQGQDSCGWCSMLLSTLLLHKFILQLLLLVSHLHLRLGGVLTCQEPGNGCALDRRGRPPKKSLSCRRSPWPGAGSSLPVLGTTAAGTTPGSGPVRGHAALPAGSLGWAWCPRISCASASMEGSARELNTALSGREPRGALRCRSRTGLPPRGQTAPERR